MGRLLTFLATLLAFFAAPLHAQQFLDPLQAFQPAVQALDARTVEVTYRVADGYYLYRDKFRFTTASAGYTLGKPVFPAGRKHQDENFGAVEVYYDRVAIRLPVERSAAASGPLTLKLVSQGCADAGLCYPPQRHELSVELPAPLPKQAQAAPPNGEAASGGANVRPLARPQVSEMLLPPLASSSALAQPPAASPASLPASSSAPSSIAAAMPPAVALTPAVDESGRIAAALRHAGFWANIAFFFAAGLGLSLTPCVFPMIPIVSGIIAGQGHRLSRARGFALSLVYVLGMAVTYALAGVAAGLTGTLVSAALQNPWVLGTFALVFCALAGSMFGFYELQLPSSLQSRISAEAGHLQGGRGPAVFAMGALSALIVGPCVAAPLAGALIYIGQTGNALLGGAALFVMALGMGVPLLVVGISAGTLLPRAGAWMETVKKAFGVLMLATAVWLLTPVLPVAVQLAAWAALLIVPAIYLHALDPLPRRAGGWSHFWKGVAILMLIVGAALLVGALSGAHDPLQPLAGLRANAASTEPAAPGFARVANVGELDSRLRAAGRPVMLDFYADWCKSCKEMERITFADPAIRARLAGYQLLRADVTANSADDAALLKRFGLYGPPGIIFFDAGGHELADLRVIGFKDPAEFAAVLDRVAAP
jgi:thioredoxin:protein disulfide reductase